MLRAPNDHPRASCIFIAQLYGIDLTLSQQNLLVVTMVLTSKGASGVPGFAIIIFSATLASAGLPLEAVALALAPHQ